MTIVYSYEDAVRRIAELTEELEQAQTLRGVDQGLLQMAGDEIRGLRSDLAVHRGALQDETVSHGKTIEALATERAAREQLADKHMRLKELYDVKYRAHEQAERERDTALARVKELEESVASAVEAREYAQRGWGAAETALASARKLLERVYQWCPYAPMAGDIATLLTSHPAPVAAANYAMTAGPDGCVRYSPKQTPVAAPCADTCPACAAEILGMDTEERHVGAACMHAPDLDEPPVAAPCAAKEQGQ